MNGNRNIKVGKVPYTLNKFAIPYGLKPSTAELALMLIVEEQGVEIVEHTIYDSKKDNFIHTRVYKIRPNMKERRR